MIHHVVMWRLRDQSARGDDAEFKDKLARNIADLRAALPGLVSLEVGHNVVPAADAADLLLHGEFESWDALRRYETHPLHDELRALIGPWRMDRRVVDYES